MKQIHKCTGKVAYRFFTPAALATRRHLRLLDADTALSLLNTEGPINRANSDQGLQNSQI